MRTWIAQLRKGLVELAILAAMRDGETYGYELLQRLRTVEGLAVTESTIYPILTRLANDGDVQVRAAPSPAGPPRRYYRLTRAGRSRFKQMIEHWTDIQAALNNLIHGDESDDDVIARLSG